MRTNGASTARTRNAITAMWARDNSVAADDDPRGRGYAPAAPDRLAAYATAGELHEVFLAAPWAAHEGPVGAWFEHACDALHDAGVELSALGGDAAWLTDPALVGRWLKDARAAADFDRVHLDVEPWASPGWQADKTAAMRGFLTVLDTARFAGGSLPLDVTTPWWLAHEPFVDGHADGTTMLDAVLARADRVSILAFADHARGPRGILTLADRAVRATVDAGRPFTIGVETDTPEAAGGAQYTFFDEGPVALLREAALVRDGLTEQPGYRGVAVENHRAWRRLLGV